MNHPISIQGKVVKILEERGKITATISIQIGLISIPIKSKPKTHLEDIIKIDGKLKIEKISVSSFNSDKAINFLSK